MPAAAGARRRVSGRPHRSGRCPAAGGRPARDRTNSPSRASYCCSDSARLAVGGIVSAPWSGRSSGTPIASSRAPGGRRPSTRAGSKASTVHASELLGARRAIQREGSSWFEPASHESSCAMERACVENRRRLVRLVGPLGAPAHHRRLVDVEADRPARRASTAGGAPQPPSSVMQCAWSWKSLIQGPVTTRRRRRRRAAAPG